MHRCAHRIAACAAALAFAIPAAAQVQRHFPPSALRGELRIGEPPHVLLDGQAARLAPGAHIHGENNMLVMSGALAGTQGIVNYTVDIGGQLKDIWILTPAERANKPWPVTVAQAKAWHFDFGTQTWTKP